ncbi:MAG: hypothetical protein ABFS12_06195 [Bacteroidota bacterium]
MNKNKFEFLIWRFFEFIVNLIGFKRIPILARIISGIFFYIIPIRRNVVVNNLRKAFPDKSDKEIKKLVRENYYSTSVTFMELLILSRSTEEEILNMVECNDVDLVKNRIAEQRGTLFLTGHFGNWELGAIYMGIVAESQINVLVKKQRNIFVADWMTKLREKFGNREITLGVSVRELFKTLSQGGAIGIVGDQRGPKDGIRVNYFNQPTMTFEGFAVLALKKKVPILVTLGRRTSSGKYAIDVTEISFDNLPDNNADAIKELNQRYMLILEDSVTKAPEQWLWMHNIWKYQ